MRRITFSRTFPYYHPKAGQPTRFVEKIWKSLWDIAATDKDKIGVIGHSEEYDSHFHPGDVGIINIHNYEPKHHTIRAGKKWKVGDKFLPVVWSGKPYRSKQIIIAPPIEVKKVWDFDVRNDAMYVGGHPVVDYIEIAKNDGLMMDDFLAWFQYPKPFDGQIIAWNENINY